MSVMSWLLEREPAIRWQVMRDLQDARPEAVAAERSRVAQEGWGAQLLALQSDQGAWGGSADRGWMTTIYTLALLKDVGVDPAAAAVRTAITRIRDHVTWWQLDGRPFFDGETEPCINGAILAAGAYFGVASPVLLARLLSEQQADGGWNCEAPSSTRSSFHTTICVLEGLLAYEQNGAASAALTSAQQRGQDYLLSRGLLRKQSTGELIDRRWLRFAFPPTWHYDVLRGLDYLRSAGVKPDERVTEAVAVVKRRSHQNGRWPLNRLHADRVSFEMEAGVGRASRWNTLRALRVLRWAQADAAQIQRQAFFPGA